ncbi:MAG: hypothetical protein AAGL98_00170 [Planctomycetota bacterium]
MNIQQFAKLAPGDIIVNDISNSRGEIVTVDGTGVRIRWHGAGKVNDEFAPTWHYSARSTAWFHWRLESAVSPELDAAIGDELANPPVSIMKDA